MHDSIADMFTRIRNAQSTLKPFTQCASTKYKLSVLDVLVREGFIKRYDVEKDGVKSNVTIFLKYHDSRPVIEKISKISKPSLPCYESFEEMVPVCNGLGIRIVSTSEGVYSDRELRAMYKNSKKRLGGCVVGEVI
jgi:small subunit ribosomal protein S8